MLRKLNMNGMVIEKFLAFLELQKILGNFCFSEQIFYRKQSLGAPDCCSDRMYVNTVPTLYNTSRVIAINRWPNTLLTFLVPIICPSFPFKVQAKKYAVTIDSMESRILSPCGQTFHQCSLKLFQYHDGKQYYQKRLKKALQYTRDISNTVV